MLGPGAGKAVVHNIFSVNANMPIKVTLVLFTLRAHLQCTAQRFLHSLMQLGLLPLELLLDLVPAGQADRCCNAAGATAARTILAL